MARRIDLSNQKFGRLIVESFSHSDQKAYWNCICECGTKKVIQGSQLKSGKTNSCGCLQKELQSIRITKANLTHGHNYVSKLGKPSRTYKSWQAMKDRCLNPDNTNYPRYGALGVKVCDRWKDSFENFLADMGERPENKTLDRINAFGNYEPNNCRWADNKVQSNNQRRFYDRT